MRKTTPEKLVETARAKEGIKRAQARRPSGQRKGLRGRRIKPTRGKDRNGWKNRPSKSREEKNRDDVKSGMAATKKQGGEKNPSGWEEAHTKKIFKLGLRNDEQREKGVPNKWENWDRVLGTRKKRERGGKMERAQWIATALVGDRKIVRKRGEE